MEQFYYYECVTKGNVWMENYITLLKEKYPEIEITGIEYDSNNANGITRLFIKSSLPLEKLYTDNNYYDYLIHSEKPTMKKVEENETNIELPKNTISFNLNENNFNIYINQLKRDNPNAVINGIWNSDELKGKIESSIPYSELNHPGYSIVIDKEGYIGERRTRDVLTKYLYKYYKDKQRYEKYPELFIDEILNKEDKKEKISETDALMIVSNYKPNDIEEKIANVSVTIAKTSLEVTEDIMLGTNKPQVSNETILTAVSRLLKRTGKSIKGEKEDVQTREYSYFKQ